MVRGDCYLKPIFSKCNIIHGITLSAHDVRYRRVRAGQGYSERCWRVVRRHDFHQRHFEANWLFVG